MHSEILTFLRVRGLFAGISLEGASRRPDEDWNKELYGKEMTNQEIVTGNTASPAAAKRLMSLLNKYSSRRG
jgi:lipid-binding SYLF domain-containing protein